MAHYHIYDQASARWLAGDERTFVRRLENAAAFTHADLATDVGAREAAKPENEGRILILVSDLGSI